MLKHNLEALQTGTKVVVDDMSSVLFGGVVGKSGEVVSLKRVVEDGDVDFHLWNPTTDKSVYLATHEYQYVRVVEPVYILDTTSEEDMEFKTGDIVKVLGENTEEFTGDHGYPVGTELMVLKYDQSDDTYFWHNFGTACVYKWVEADKLVKQETPDAEVEGIKVGDTCIVVGNGNGQIHFFDIGDEVVVISTEDMGIRNCRRVGDGVMQYVGVNDLQIKDSTPEEQLANLDKSEKLLAEYPEGTKVRYVGEPNIYYNQGEVYSIGTDEWGDYGVLDEEDSVYHIGCIQEVDRMGNYECFNPEDWEVVKDVLDVEKLKERYPVGTKVKYIGEESDDNSYVNGEVYQVGVDSYEDYGVLVEAGYVISPGCIQLSSHVLEGALFDPKDWEIMEEVKPMTAVASVEDLKERYPQGNKVEYVGSGANWRYTRGRVYTVGYDYFGDYGVKDENGLVLVTGLMVDSDVGTIEDFDPTDWKIVEEVVQEEVMESTEDKDPDYQEAIEFLRNLSKSLNVVLEKLDK